jgi:7,8-dihydropterin-6-yl-methyl-4-(beta-D-ribofuranosyl)aminobenzene 5'-phosphate synthase
MISLRCLVDNTAQHSSTLWGEHGVSFAIETPHGKILFDTGQSGDVLVHNAEQMGIQLNQFSALAISHAHYDHTGGIEGFMAMARQDIALYASPALFQERFEMKEGQPQFIGMKLSRAQLSQKFDLRLGVEPMQILPGVWTTGEICDRSALEGRSSQHFIKENGEWQPDPYRDDLSLVLETSDGLVVVCGCCHAGLLNTLAHVRQVFQKPIRTIIGGTHLMSLTAEALTHVVETLGSTFHPHTLSLYPNHCTGEQAFLALVDRFGDQVGPCPAGTVLHFA